MKEKWEDLPDTNWEYIEQRRRESEEVIERSKRFSLSSKEAREISEQQNAFRFRDKETS